MKYASVSELKMYLLTKYNQFDTNWLVFHVSEKRSP